MARPQSQDTSESAERMLFERYRDMAPWEKLRVVSELSMAAYQFAAAGIRLRYPAATDEQVKLAIASRRLGPELVRRASGRDPNRFGE